MVNGHAKEGRSHGIEEKAARLCVALPYPVILPPYKPGRIIGQHNLFEISTIFGCC
jgi:hypothetical protein